MVHKSLFICEAVRALYAHEPNAGSEPDRTFWSLGLHCLSRYFKYRKIPYERSFKFLRSFTEKNLQGNHFTLGVYKPNETIKEIWDQSSAQMPCAILNELHSSNGRSFCENLCNQARSPMYALVPKASRKAEFVSLSSRRKQLHDVLAKDSEGSNYKLINAEFGVGKTTALLRKIAKRNNKVLYLAPRHNLLKEIKRKYLKEGGSSDEIIIYKGIDHSDCRYRSKVKDLMRRGIPYNIFCKEVCDKNSRHNYYRRCIYRRQSAIARTKRVLLMATPSLRTEQIFERDDFDNLNRTIVVIDEDHLEHKSVQRKMTLRDLGDNFILLDSLVKEKEIVSLTPLVDVAAKLFEYCKGKTAVDLAPDMYLEPGNKTIDDSNYATLSSAVYKYAQTKPNFTSLINDLMGIYRRGGTVHRKTAKNGKPFLIYHKDLYYPDNKTYYLLDGSADVSLYKRLFNEVEPLLATDSKKLEMFDRSEIIQYVEHSFSITSLKKEERSARLEEILRVILSAKRYQKHPVGIIAKKDLKENLYNFIEEEFSDRLERIKIKHFGDISGVDVFKKYPVGIVIGMNNLSFTDYARQVQRLFGKCLTAEHDYGWTELLSTQDYTYKVMNPVFADPLVQAMFRQFCIGSTIQAIGRWRPYEKHDRDFCHIFLLNNYDTGLAVRPVSKAQLYQFLDLPNRTQENKGKQVEIIATEIMRSEGRVKNSDVRERTGYNKSTVSNSLRKFAQRVGWIQRENHYYYEQ